MDDAELEKLHAQARAYWVRMDAAYQLLKAGECRGLMFSCGQIVRIKILPHADYSPKVIVGLNCGLGGYHVGTQIDFVIRLLTADGKRVSQEHRFVPPDVVESVERLGVYTLAIQPQGKEKKMPA